MLLDRLGVRFRPHWVLHVYQMQSVVVLAPQHAKRLQGNAVDQQRRLAALQRQASQLAEHTRAHELHLKRCASPQAVGGKLCLTADCPGH